MEGATKPGADLLWAFQLHREHRALAKRLIAAEASTARQNDRITAGEQSAHPAQQERVDALTVRLRKLEDSDTNEQVARLASELRGARQQLEQVRDKVKLVEKAHKEAASKAEKGDETFQDKVGELSNVVAQLQRFAEHSENRFKQLVEHGARATADGYKASSERHENQIKGMGEQLSGLERAQGHLRSFIEDVRQDHRVALAVSTSTRSKARKDINNDETLATSNETPGESGPPQSEPQAVSKRPAQERDALDLPASRRLDNIIAPDLETPALPVTRAEAKKPSGPIKRKRGLEKEITQLIHGDGSLTNAPVVLDSQSLGITTRGNKKLKVEPFEGRSLRSALNKPDTQSRVQKVKEKPATTRAKIAVQPQETLVTVSKKAAKPKPAGRPPKNAVTKTRGRRGMPEATETPVPKQILSLSSSSQIQVAYSRGSSARREAPCAASPQMPAETEGCPREQRQLRTQPRPQKRRRRIEQDDSMEEFIAKCEAAMET